MTTIFPVVFFLLFLWRSTPASEATNRRGWEPGGVWWPSWGQVAEIVVVVGFKRAITQGRVGGGKNTGARGAGAACSPTESPARTALVGKLLTSDHGHQPPMGS